MRVISGLGLIGIFGLLAAFAHTFFPEIAAWAVTPQRVFQNEIARAVYDLRACEAGAWALLLSAAGVYGFVHAVGPGHEKYLIGGVGFGQAVSARRLLTIAVVSTLVQAIWAIVLAYGGFYLLEVSAQSLPTAAETHLASASNLAIGIVGMILIWRGFSQLRKQARSVYTDDAHHGEDWVCHAHGPRLEDVARLTS